MVAEEGYATNYCNFVKSTDFRYFTKCERTRDIV